MEEVANGTLTADGSEQTLATETDPGSYVLKVNLTNMANGDVVEIRIKDKVLSTDTSEQADEGNYADVQINPVVWSLPIPVSNEVVATLKQVAGTNRDFPWALFLL